MPDLWGYVNNSMIFARFTFLFLMFLNLLVVLLLARGFSHVTSYFISFVADVYLIISFVYHLYAKETPPTRHPYKIYPGPFIT